MDDIAIKIEGVYKDFVLPHERAGSVKGIFTSMFRKATSKKEAQHALKDISFEIKKGEFFGIVGRNGSGKSTLLKILAGIYQPTKGKVSTSGKLVPFIELGVGFNPELTGRDNVYLNGAILGFSVKEVDAMYNDIVDFAELERFMDQKLKNYSSGMQVRLAFSMAIRAEADILLIDEVLAVGDADFQRKCFEYFKKLKRDKKTVVFVSHDMEAVREYCTRAILINDNQVVEEGEANKVAQEYTKLLNDNSNITDNEVSTDVERWGNNKARTSEVLIKVFPTEVVISQSIMVAANIDGLIAGFRITNAFGDSVTGTNTRLENKPIGQLSEGKTVRLEWAVPNIFSDGKYYFDCTIHSRDGSSVFDWWERAAHFRVKKERQLPFYSVDPTFSLSVNVDQLS